MVSLVAVGEGEVVTGFVWIAGVFDDCCGIVGWSDV